jgi:hypothetical protein
MATASSLSALSTFPLNSTRLLRRSLSSSPPPSPSLPSPDCARTRCSFPHSAATTTVRRPSRASCPSAPRNRRELLIPLPRHCSDLIEWILHRIWARLLASARSPEISGRQPARPDFSQASLANMRPQLKGNAPRIARRQDAAQALRRNGHASRIWPCGRRTDGLAQARCFPRSFSAQLVCPSADLAAPLSPLGWCSPQVFHCTESLPHAPRLPLALPRIAPALLFRSPSSPSSQPFLLHRLTQSLVRTHSTLRPP